MRKSITTFLAALMTLAIATPAMANTGPTYVNDEGALVDDSGATRKLLFEDGESLEGEVLRLDDDILYSNRGRHFRSLITFRQTFIPQLIKLSLDAPF